MTDSSRLDGQVANVTGAGQGLGQGIALALAIAPYFHFPLFDFGQHLDAHIHAYRLSLSLYISYTCVTCP